MAASRPTCPDGGARLPRLRRGGGQAGRMDLLIPWQAGLWRFLISNDTRLLAGVTDRSGDLERLRTCLHPDARWGRQARVACGRGLVLAEQIHGASLAAIETTDPPANPIAGCDGLTTRVRGLALVIRTADCLPIVVWDPIQEVVGLIHAGWRGLVSRLPMRVVSFVQRVYHSRPQDLWVGIGPAIRSCCYEVGKEFEPRFGSFVHPAPRKLRPFPRRLPRDPSPRNPERERGTGWGGGAKCPEGFLPEATPPLAGWGGVHTGRGRLTCDLIGCATQQLVASGVRPWRVVDSGQCTSCEAVRWHSVRRDGEHGGRLLSFVMVT